MATRHEGVWRSEDTGPRILDLCTGRRTVVSFTPRPLCPRWKQLLGPIEQGGGGGRTQGIVRRLWRKEKSVAAVRNRALIRPFYSP